MFNKISRQSDRAKQGSILILALWALTFLGIFAMNIGLRVRQRASLISRIESDSQLRYIAQAGVKKAVSALRYDFTRNNFQLTASGKMYRYANPKKFSHINLGPGRYSVFYPSYGNSGFSSEEEYGVVDEERKLNINMASKESLASLIESVTGIDSHAATALAEAIIDWRSIGESQITGFYSDAYYANLVDPYKPKSAPFENIEELLLLRGFTQKLYDELRPYLTVYGDGKINVNTAPQEVLLALGLSEDVTQKLLLARRGPDNVEMSYDDHIFLKSYDIASQVQDVTKLKETQMKELDRLNAQGLIKTRSSFYSIASKAELNGKTGSLVVEAVYDGSENKIIFWREK